MSRCIPVAFGLWLSGLFAVSPVAAETVAVTPALAPGLALDVVVTRERAVDNDGHWLLEAKSRTFARLRVLDRVPQGWRLSWSIARIVHDVAPGEPSEVAKKLGSIVVGLAFEAETDAAGRPVAIRERERVREWLHGATDRTVEGIEAELIEQGYPADQVGQVGTAMRRPFHELADAPDARFDRVYLQDAAILLDLAGRRLPVGAELRRELAGPVPMVVDHEPRLAVRETARWVVEPGAGRRLVVERSEALAEEIEPREVLARFPGLLTMIRRMDAEEQERTLDELPPVSFERHTVWTLDGTDFLPVRVEREERLAIGGLGRRTLTTYEVAPAGG